jgi:ABC-2 type transport system ATP-binding protein
VSSSSVAIHADHIRKAYANYIAVHHVSLRVPVGTIFGLLGPNGGGKTTTIRMILNLMIPDSGRIEVFGRPNGDAALVNRLGYLPEERGLYRKMEVRRVLRFLARLKGISSREADKRIDRWLERFAMTGAGRDLGTARVEELSRGMQQKVQFIGTVLHEPELIVLDEPFSGLDPVNAQALKDTVLELRQQGRTILFSTHLMDVAERMCDAVAIVNRGHIVLNGDMREVKASQPTTPRVAVTFDSGSADRARAILADQSLVAEIDDHGHHVDITLAAGATSQHLLARLVAADVSIARFDRIEPSLHQIFLQRVGATGVEAGMSGHG